MSIESNLCSYGCNQKAWNATMTKINTFLPNGLSLLESQISKWGKCKIQSYKNTNLFYQGSYEYNWLEKQEHKLGSLSELIKQVCRGPAIPYINPLTNGVHRYMPDFLFNNTIYEIKSSWTWYSKIDVNIAKLKAASTVFKVKIVLDHHEFDLADLI